MSFRDRERSVHLPEGHTWETLRVLLSRRLLHGEIGTTVVIYGPPASGKTFAVENFLRPSGVYRLPDTDRNVESDYVAPADTKALCFYYPDAVFTPRLACNAASIAVGTTARGNQPCDKPKDVRIHGNVLIVANSGVDLSDLPGLAKGFLFVEMSDTPELPLSMPPGHSWESLRQLLAIRRDQFDVGTLVIVRGRNAHFSPFGRTHSVKRFLDVERMYELDLIVPVHGSTSVRFDRKVPAVYFNPTEEMLASQKFIDSIKQILVGMDVVVTNKDPKRFCANVLLEVGHDFDTSCFRDCLVVDTRILSLPEEGDTGKKRRTRQ